MDQQIQYCTAHGGARLAYTVTGEGPPLVWVSGWVSHLELEWGSRARRPSLELLAGRVRLIRHDKRGTGLSARGLEDYSFEASVQDLETLVRHLGLTRFAIGGLSEGAAIAIAYAARHPERVTRLVLLGSYARGAGLMAPTELLEAVRAVVKTRWGLASNLLAAVFLDDSSNVRQELFSRFQRSAAKAEDAAALLDRAVNIDIRPLLPSISAPALVFHHRDDTVVPLQLGQEVAACIKGARFLSAPGAHIPSEQGWLDFTRAALAFLLDEDLDTVRSYRAAGTSGPGGSGGADAEARGSHALRIDEDRHLVVRNGVPIDLSPTEFRLLLALAGAPGRLHSYTELLHRVWGAEYVGEMDFLHVYVSRLRKKLGQDVIVTERGFGYRLETGEPTSA